MAHLGDFGEQPDEPEDVTFGYFGETIRVNPDLTELDYLDFLEVADGLEENGHEAGPALKGFARQCIHVEDFDRFWAAARNNRQGIRQLFELLGKVTAASAERPTERSSGSAGGPQNTGTRSADVDLSTALEHYEGRPDFQLALVRAHEDRAAG